MNLSLDQIAILIMAPIVDGAPITLDTLNEIAAALGDDPNFAATMTAQLATKLSNANGTGGQANLTDNIISTAKLVNKAMTLAKLADITGLTMLGAVSGTGSPVTLTPAQVIPVIGISTFVRTILDDAATVFSTLGVSSFIPTLLDGTNASTAQTTLGIFNFHQGHCLMMSALRPLARPSLLPVSPPAVGYNQTDNPIGSIIGFYSSNGLVAFLHPFHGECSRCASGRLWALDTSEPWHCLERGLVAAASARMVPTFGLLDRGSASVAYRRNQLSQVRLHDRR
ncbi:hypothetical protein [Ramlibacter humi]|uniref:Uncharacterized protein n=1 Tax=Ramlibacter humi TaxID=2530451 RepID=A0A4Z0BQA1_9BURK|nr:hypothetical protein [Ramlibacter humi]TFZ00225.1 hypothetical protein EZ216_14085 [Ramlibacter humi]